MPGTMNEEEPRVLVVGAGPSGLVLALSLLRNGVSVRLIEKSPVMRIGQRGAAIMPRSMELFHYLGVADRILTASRPTPPVKWYGHRGGLRPLKIFEMAPEMEPTPGVPYNNIVCLGQDSVESTLREELASRYDIHVELGTELVSFHQHRSSVAAVIRKHGKEETSSYGWIIGTDGARGPTRKLLGASFLGETRNVQNIVVGDVMLEGLDFDHWHMWGETSKTLVSLRPTEIPGLFNFILAGDTVDNSELSGQAEDLRLTLKHVMGTYDRVKFGEVKWHSTYRPNIRMASRLGDGRVYLAGDSAHVHSFTGGQGMNTGIQDSFNLGWKLALVDKHLAPHSLLQTYAEERLPVIASMLAHTTSLLDKSYENKENPGAWSRDGNLLQLDMNYRWSSLVVDEQRMGNDDIDSDDEDAVLDYNSRLAAGDRAPDAPGLLDPRWSSSASSQPVRLFDIFRCSHHTVLVFSDNTKTAACVFQWLSSDFCREFTRSVLLLRPGELPPIYTDLADHVLEDVDGHAKSSYDLREGCTTVVVRPDGVIGAIVRGVEGLDAYFHGVFGRLP